MLDSGPTAHNGGEGAELPSQPAQAAPPPGQFLTGKQEHCEKTISFYPRDFLFIGSVYVKLCTDFNPSMQT